MSNSLASSSTKHSSLSEILLSSHWANQEVLMATQGSGYISGGEKPKYPLFNRIGRALSKTENERNALLATREQLKQDIQELCVGDDAISLRFDQAFNPGARITKQAVIRFLKKEGLIIPFGESKSPILASGKWQLSPESTAALNDRFKEYRKNSTCSEKLEENADACRRDIARGLCIAFDEISNKATTALGMENEDYDIKKDPRVLQAEEVLTAVASEKFPNDEAKASVLKNELMALSHQGMLGPLMESFRDAEYPIQGFFVQGGLQPGSEYSYSVVDGKISISLTGNIQPKLSTTTLISSAFNNQDHVESSFDHTSQGAISINLVVTLDPKTGCISSLECHSAKGTWNIQPKVEASTSSSPITVSEGSSHGSTDGASVSSESSQKISFAGTQVFSSGDFSLTAENLAIINQETSVNLAKSKQPGYVSTFEKDIARGFNHTIDELTTEGSSERITTADAVILKISTEICSDATAAANLKNNLEKVFHQGRLAPISFLFKNKQAPENTCFVSGGMKADFTYSKLKETQIKISIEGKTAPNPYAMTTLYTSSGALNSNDYSGETTLSAEMIATIDPTTGEIRALEYQSVDGTWNIESKSKLST